MCMKRTVCQLVCDDSTGGSIVQPGTSTSLLYVESHYAMCHVIFVDTSHLLVTARPRRKDLSRNINPSLILCLHAVYLREHAKDV